MQYDDFDDFEVSGDASVDLMPYVRKALASWRTILKWALAASLIGIIIGFSKPKEYTTRAVVAPEITTRTGSGGLSSLASLAGINMNTMALTDAMHPDLYPEIIRSSSFMIGLFDLPVDIEKRDTVIHTDLYDYMVNHTRAPWWGYIFGLPHKMMDGARRLFSRKDDPDDAEGYAQLDSLRLTKQQEMVVKALSKCITAKVEKKTYVLMLRVTMQDRYIAAQVANAVIANLQEFVVRYRTEKARENADYYEVLYEETKDAYFKAQTQYADYLDSHQGLVGKRVMVEQQHLQNEANLRYQIYNQTAQNLLNARAKVQQESPVLVVVQPGIASHIGKPSKVKLAFVWFVLGAALGAVWVLFLRDKWARKEAGGEAEA
ncbi:MAG: chain-length determining protein [Bacteroidales bacterium]|nr:chain-length determining protein [Bacteroidales bacterium]